MGFSALVAIVFLCHGSTELVLSLSKRHGIALKDTTMTVLVGFCVLELWWLFFFSATKTRKHGIALKDTTMKALVSFSALELWWLFFFSATEARKHGIALKDLKQKALVGFSALVAILFRHGSTKTRNSTKRSHPNEGNSLR